MRVGIDTRFYNKTPSGIGRYSYELCSNLLKYNDLELVLFINPSSPILDDSKFSKIEKIIIKEKLFSIPSIFTLGKKIDNANLDIYHSPSFIMPFVKKTKTIITIHDLIHLKFSEDYSFFHKLYYEKIVKKNALKAHKIITDSKHSKKDIQEWLDIDNIDITYMGVDKNFTPSIGFSDTLTNLRGENFILCVGNNKTHKNLKRLLYAYANLKNKYEDFYSLLIISSKNHEFENIIKENILEDDVIFVNNITEDELILLYSHAMFFIFPSLYEGFGLPIIEAMSCGCPVTCSDQTSIPEVANDAVLYFNPYDIKSIEEALERMFFDKNLLDSLILKGKKQSQNFSWEKTAFETYNIYIETFNAI